MGTITQFPRASSRRTSISPPENLEQIKQELDRHRSGISQERDRLQHLENAAKERLEGLQRNREVTEDRLKQSETELQKLTQQLKQQQTQLGDAQFVYQQTAAAVSARLRFLQRQPQQYGWALLLNSENLTELMARRHQLQLLYKSDRQILEQLKQSSDRLNQQTLAIEQKKNEISLLRQQLLAQKSDFDSQAKIQQELVGRLASDRNALEAAQAQLKRDSEGITFLIQQRLAVRPSGFPGILGTGRMGIPNDGTDLQRFWLANPPDPRLRTLPRGNRFCLRLWQYYLCIPSRGCDFCGLVWRLWQFSHSRSWEWHYHPIRPC
uniref:Murein hydrolase activator EnvC family protein n=1 Tax=Desertifilum tharense IPPAS B-1220 TaxID=1781255 RepID=A0ACD5GUJ5_9CYAN